MNNFPLQTNELQCYTYLQGRRTFSKKECQMNHKLQKGYIGEKKFAQLIRNHVTSDYIALYDLLLEGGGTIYQIDSLLIFPNQINLIEVKYFKGEFIYNDDSFYDCLGKVEFRNPIDQLNRTSIYFRNLLRKLQINLPLHAHLVFNHNQFTLFQLKQQTPILLQSQLPTFTNLLSHQPGRLQQFHFNLADKLKQMHIPQSPYENLPDYEYSTLQKGILCYQCRSKMKIHLRKLHCMKCTYKESLDSGILRNIIEFHTLFPNRKIKTGIIEEWCGYMVSRRTIIRVLQTFMKSIPNFSGSYYSFLE